MSSKSNKKQAKKANELNPSVDVSKDAVSEVVGNYDKHPFFVKKANEAKAFLAKVGLPKELASKASN